MAYYIKSITDNNQQREKAHEVKSNRKQMQASKSFLPLPPVELHGMH